MLSADRLLSYYTVYLLQNTIILFWFFLSYIKRIKTGYSIVLNSCTIYILCGYCCKPIAARIISCQYCIYTPYWNRHKQKGCYDIVPEKNDCHKPHFITNFHDFSILAVYTCRWVVLSLILVCAVALMSKRTPNLL